MYQDRFPYEMILEIYIVSESFLMSQLFPSDGQNPGVSASVSVLSINKGLISFRIDWFDLLAVQGTLALYL